VRGSGRTAAGEEQQESALVTADFKILFPSGKNQESANRFWPLIKKLNYFFALKTLNETVAEIENQPCYPA
jgi:hypothetical protein